jgi:DNA anti-recombination protein RmuC
LLIVSSREVFSAESSLILSLAVSLKEEIESLRDELINIGQEHVTAKDRIKELSAEKVAERTLRLLNSSLSEVCTFAESAEVEALLARSSATRFKDLTDLRETLQKVQPELRSLRAESSELKTLY